MQKSTTMNAAGFLHGGRMTKYREILRLRNLGLSQNDIATSCQVSKKTVNRVLKLAKEHNLNWPLEERLTDNEIDKIIHPNGNEARKITDRKLPDYERVKNELHRNGVNKKLFWQNIFITGATGCGKTYMACAFGYEACRQFYTNRFVRLPDLLIELEMARENRTFTKAMLKYTKPTLLIIDEWLLLKPSENEQKTIFCSQYPSSEWYDQLGGMANPLTDSILDRIILN